MATFKSTPNQTNEYTTVQAYSIKNKKGELILNVRALNDLDALYKAGVPGEWSMASNSLSTKTDTNEAKVV